LNLQKAFENWQDRPWLAFKRELFNRKKYLVDIKTAELALAGFQKLSAQL
jgi:hypothetical protein